MKHLLTLIALLLVVGVQGAYTQKKNDTSNYNYKRAMEILDNDGNPDEALEWLNKQLQENPKHGDALIARAMYFYSKEEYGKSLSDLNNAIKYYNKHNEYKMSSIYTGRAMVYEDMGELEKAIADYTSAYDNTKNEDTSLSHITSILESRAHIYYTQKNYSAADNDYRLMLKHDEANQVAMVGLARNMIMREEHQKAVDMLNSCQKYGDHYDQIYRFRLQAYDKLGEVDMAIDDAIEYYGISDNSDIELVESTLKKHFSYALAKVSEKLNSADEDMRPYWMVFKGQIYALGYDYTSAIDLYNQLEKEYGENVNTTYYRAQWYAEIDDYDRAIADMLKCVEETAEKKVYPIMHLTSFYRQNGQFDEAIKWASKLIDLIPTDAFGYYVRGWCNELKGNDKEAMKNYNAGIDVDKEYPNIYLMRGEQYLKQGDKERANADFEEILKQDTIAEDGTCRMYALHFLGRDAEAIEWMDKVIENDPDNKGHYYDQACLYARMGRLQESVAALRTAFEKGYRTFAHIEADDDMDAIREMPEFKALIKEYKAKPIRIEEEEVEETSSDLIASTSEVQMRKMRSGVYEVPCTINDLPLKFIFDTGASTTTISSVEAAFMLKNGYLTENDIRGKEYYSTATGEIHEGTVIRLREIKIGDAVLRNVDASVTHSQQAPLLLGQSVMERFGAIAIDNSTSKLTIKHKSNIITIN